jgi:hypothetical protein
MNPTDVSIDTPEQQRRRNSSIAKLLGGYPLNNQQYEGKRASSIVIKLALTSANVSR